MSNKIQAACVMALSLGSLGCACGSNGGSPTAETSGVAFDEITLKRYGHRPNAPWYTIVLKKDGSLTYTGEHDVARIGQYRAVLDEKTLARLSRMMGTLHVLDAKESAIIYDEDVTELHITSKGKNRTITHGNNGTTPDEVWAIDAMIDGMIANVSDWKKVTAP